MIDDIDNSIKDKKIKLRRVRRYLQYLMDIYENWITILSLFVVIIGVITAGMTSLQHDLKVIIYILDGILTVIGTITAILSRLKKEKVERIENMFKVLANMAEFTSLTDKYACKIVNYQVLYNMEFNTEEMGNLFIENLSNENEIYNNKLKIIEEIRSDIKTLFEKYERLLREYDEQIARFNQSENKASQKDYEYQKGCLTACWGIPAAICWSCCRVNFNHVSTEKVNTNSLGNREIRIRLDKPSCDDLDKRYELERDSSSEHKEKNNEE